MYEKLMEWAERVDVKVYSAFLNTPFRHQEGCGENRPFATQSCICEDAFKARKAFDFMCYRFFDSGYDEGSEEGFGNGYDEGYEAGKIYGYDFGYEDGIGAS